MDIDISLMGYDQWVRFLFEHPVPEDEDHESKWSNDITCEVSQPAGLIRHVTRMCRELTQIGQRYTAAQVDQGIWFLLSYPGEFGPFLLHTQVPIERRLECIRAMYQVYSDYVTTLPSPIPNCFDMWWDLICHDFWSKVEQRLKPINLVDTNLGKLIQDANAAIDLATRALSDEIVIAADKRQQAMAKMAAERAAMIPHLTEDERMIFEALFETLQRISELPKNFCQYCAFHGLGHLHHPGVKAVELRFMEGPGRFMPPSNKHWLRECAEGRIM